MQFVELQNSDFDRFKAYIAEFSGGGDSSYPGFDLYTEFLKYVVLLENNKHGRDLRPGYVAAESWFWKAEDGRFMGRVVFRRELTANLLIEGGHIGYEIRPSERHKGLATSMMRQFLSEVVPDSMDRLLITCDESNVASEKVILNVGGVYEDTRIFPRTGKPTKRFWVTIPKTTR